MTSRVKLCAIPEQLCLYSNTVALSCWPYLLANFSPWKNSVDASNYWKEELSCEELKMAFKNPMPYTSAASSIKVIRNEFRVLNRTTAPMGSLH